MTNASKMYASLSHNLKFLDIIVKFDIDEAGIILDKRVVEFLEEGLE